MTPSESSRRDLQSGNGPVASGAQQIMKIYKILKKRKLFLKKKHQKCNIDVKWVGSGRGTSILCQDDQLGTPEVLGPILAKKSWKKQ